MSAKRVMRVLAGTAGVLLVAGAAGTGAAAVTAEDSGDVQATVRKTVRQTASAAGEITSSRMYTQISAVGNGTKTVKVPIGTTSNRNLNEFGPFPMEGESMVVQLTVADGGGTEERTVTDASELNPMEVSVKVMLDGAEIAPEDVVGASGVLDVEYTVRNTTATTVPVTFTDVEGKEITEDVDKADPFAGSLAVVLPKGFNEVTAPGATVGGNGRNETQLGYTFVLFPPLGSAEVKVGYQSRINNGQMPAAVFQFLPIVPFDNSTIAGTAEAWKGGAETGATIYGAGTGIGDNLLKLQDGAGKLVAGLGQLSAGASQLSDGLVNTVAPGTAALAGGANDVADGLDQLNSNVPALEEGISDLNAGAKTLNSGAETLAESNASLAAGIASLNNGLNTLSKSVDALPATVQEQLKTNVDYQRLLGTLTALIAGIGVPTDTSSATLLGGLNQVVGGLRFPGTTDCAVALTGGTPTKCGVADANALVAGQLTGAAPQLTELANGFRALVPALPPAQRAVQTELADCIDGTTQCDGTPFGLPGTWPKDTILMQTQGAGKALNDVVNSIDLKLIPGVKGIQKALYNTPCDPKAAPGTATACGYAQALTLVRDGIPQLVSALTASIKQTLLAGIGTSPAAKGCDPTKSLTCVSAALTAGSAAIASGASQLADGTETLSEGTETLNDGVPTLASGVEQLANGADTLADGADKLAAGVADRLAPGSVTIADGLAQAEPGGAQIEDGAGQLKKEGADVLAKSGKDAQLGFAKDVALLEASQQAGLEGAGIPFGPAEGTDVVTTGAYKMELAGIAADTENNALKFGLGALLIAGAGGVAFAAARKFAA